MQDGYLLKLEPSGNVYNSLLTFLCDSPPVSHPPVDPEQPYEPVHTGYFEGEINDSGEIRHILTYVPPHFTTSGAGVFLFLDNGQTLEGIRAAGIWQRLSEKHGFALIALEAGADGWRKKEIQKEINYAREALGTALKRDLYSLNESSYYALGLGAGAYPALAFALLYCGVLAGVAADGDCALHPELLRQIGTLASDGDPALTKAQVPLPAWLIDRDQCADKTLQYLKAANAAEEEGFSNGVASVWRQNRRETTPSVDGLAISEVWYTCGADAAAMSQDILYERMLHFLLEKKRWMEGTNGALRMARSAEAMGLRYFETVFEGKKRHWYVFVPSAHEREPGRKLPLVLALHGYSCTGKLFAENSEWHVVAEKRDFFVIYPTAYPGEMGGRCTPLPLWNCDQFAGETGINDTGFLLHVLDEAEKIYPIDPVRIYAAGHSNGSAMTQRLMETAGQRFAAFAPVGYTFGEIAQAGEKRRFLQLPRDGVKRPVWLMKGSYDVGCKADLYEGSANERFLREVCEANGLALKECSVSRNGRYLTRTYCDNTGMPLLRFSEVLGLPHAYTPDMAQLMWDSFLCCFSRTADGNIRYER